LAKGLIPIDILSVEISVLAFATEDENKVEVAVRNLFPKEMGRFRLKRQKLSGYHKDPISLITANIKRKKEATDIYYNIIGKMSPINLERLLDELEDRVDSSGNLYIRLDKQRAFKGNINIQDVDPIRLKFKFRIPHGKKPLDYIRYVIESMIDRNSSE
jgi:RNA binding exosome subunit